VRIRTWICPPAWEPRADRVVDEPDGHYLIFNTVPKGRDVFLPVLNHNGFRALEFPCRRDDSLRFDARTGLSVEVRPTRWGDWHADVN
jgi:hypothetical protein